ncbi:MAG: ArsR family transcriptional regulator [Verrucomicrobia bacterium]|nr:ArsR family transcriptional regulator [Verrucomicrobiota bacterium]
MDTTPPISVSPIAAKTAEVPAVAVSPDPNQVPISAPSDATVLLDPVTVLAAASDAARFGMLKAMAGGAQMSVTELSARLGKAPDLVSKHLKLLREARMLMPVASPDGDGRKQFHEIPAPFRKRDAAGHVLLDFGTVLIRCG